MYLNIWPISGLEKCNSHGKVYRETAPQQTHNTTRQVQKKGRRTSATRFRIVVQKNLGELNYFCQWGQRLNGEVVTLPNGCE